MSNAKDKLCGAKLWGNSPSDAKSRHLEFEIQRIPSRVEDIKITMVVGNTEYEMNVEVGRFATVMSKLLSELHSEAWETVSSMNKRTYRLEVERNRCRYELEKLQQVKPET